MDEDLSPAPDSAEDLVSATDDEREKVKDFVFRHFREVTDGLEPAGKDYGSSTQRDKQPVNKAHCRIQQGAVFSGKILSFECSVCKDGLTYSPNDLLKHFQVSHVGTLPTYPCDLCFFCSNEFPALQRHRIKHRNTLVTCELCNDGMKYSLLLLTRHYIMCHSLNGQFSCDWCEFTTVDAGTFVQHIHHHNESPWKCSRCKHISRNEDDHNKHLKAHSGMFHFTCQLCGYGAARSEYLKNHMAAVHRDTNDTTANSSAGFKHVLKKSEPQGSPRTSKLNSVSASLANQNGRIITPETSSEDSQQLVGKTWSKPSVGTESTTEDYDESLSSDAAAHISANGLTVLMVKNKISLPRNCTTKVMGFKMVEGKKHLVLKVIPAGKLESSPQKGFASGDLSSSAQLSILDQSKETVENGDISCSKSLNPSSVSPRGGSCLQTDQDEIMTVKVKIEEEETSVCSLDCSSQRDAAEEHTNMSKHSSSPSSNTLDALTTEQDQDPKKSRSDTSLLDHSSTLSPCPKSNNTWMVRDRRVTRLAAPLKVSHKNFVFKHVSRQTGRNCNAADELAENDIDTYLNTVENENQPTLRTPENQNHANDRANIFNHVTVIVEPPSSRSSPQCCRESDTYSENSKLSPNQDVFSFHNYSKESFNISPNTTQNCDDLSELSEDEHGDLFNMTLPESPERSAGSTEEDFRQRGVQKVSESETELEESAADESVLQNFNIIKIEEESIPISQNPSEVEDIGPISTDSFVEENSDRIITRQIHRDRAGSSCSGRDSVKQGSTLRVVKLPEGKQPVLLRTSENRLSVPLQLKASPGFKLITSSTNPQINVSYMASGSNGQNNPMENPPLRTGVSDPNTETPDRGTTLVSAVQSGVSSSSNQLLLNSPSLKGHVLLSGTTQNISADKKTQPTCFFVQRSGPLVQTNSTPGLRLASTQLPLNSRPVLAMPVNTADKPLQAGRQTFLLRYISPSKSGILLNPDAKATIQGIQTKESTANKVIFKIITPSGSLLTSGATTSSSQPLFLATHPQTQCFLLSANRNTSSSMKTLEAKEPRNSPSQVGNQGPDAEKPALAPRPVRPPSQRKRRRKALFDELPETVFKAQRLATRTTMERESTLGWTPAAKHVERTLRLSPVSSLQLVRCPRRYQPVVVLNHPDADVPEVSSIMKVVRRHKGAVTKVSLSQRTLQILAEPQNYSTNLSHSDDLRTVHSSVRERFLLKMKLRKKSRRKYEVLHNLAGRVQEAGVFTCWFCGRLFKSQEDWIGHGQRHLMEATRDWNQLF